MTSRYSSFSLLFFHTRETRKFFNVGLAILGFWMLSPRMVEAAVTETGAIATSGPTPPVTQFIGYMGSGFFTVNTLTTPNPRTTSTISGSAYLGYNLGDSGTITVDGSGAVLTIAGQLVDGYQGSGEVDVENGGVLFANYSGTNLFGETLTSTSILNISSGGQFTATAGIQTATATISVDGAGSTLTMGYLNLAFSSSGTGILNITNGATATFSALDASRNGSGSTSTVTVDGATLTSTGAFNLGGVNSSISVTGGSQVNTGGVLIDSVSSDTTGTAIVSGVGTKWTANGLTIGAGGNGSLTIKDGAVFQTTGFIQLAGNNAGAVSGRLKIGDGGAPGTLDAAYIQGGINGNGTSILEFDHNSSDYYFTNDSTASGTAIAVQGNTQIVVTSGTTTLSSSSDTYTGGTQINGGTLIAANNSALGTSAVNVSGGTLQINSGHTVANTITLSGGSLAQQVNAGTQFSTLHSATSAINGGITTTAQLLGGVSSDATTILSSYSRVSAAPNDNVRISDVFTLSGVSVVDANTGQTDTFVLQLKLDPSLVTLNSELGWLDPQTNLWTTAVNGNIGGTATFIAGAYNAATDDQLGDYGVDTANGTVWAVLDHNSSFAVVTPVPEPSTWLLFGLALMALVAFSQRRKE